MNGGIDACIGTSLDGGETIFNRVPTIDALKSLVVEGFDAQFERDEKTFVLKICQIFQDLIFDAIGTCANDEPDNIFDRKCFLVTLAQHVQGSIGVGIGLEIGQILACPTVAFLVKLDAFLNLLADAFFGGAIGGVEGFVAAKGATASAEGPVTVGTGEAGRDGEFLDTGAEEPFIIDTV